MSIRAKAKQLPPANGSAYPLPTLSDNVLKALLFTPADAYGHWGLPFYLEGEPGVGKSSRIVAVAESCGLPVVTRHASIHEPTDFAGMPVVRGDRVAQLPLSWAARAAELEDCVIFLDEATTAASSTQDALLGLVLDRRVGDLELPLGVRVVSAGNPAETSQGREWKPAQANRFLHFNTKLDAEEWKTHTLGSDDEEELRVPLRAPTQAARDLQAHVRKLWPSYFREAKLLIVSYVCSTHVDENNPVLHSMPDETSPDYGRAWASPRSWEYVYRALAGARLHGLSVAEQMDVMRAAVGPGVAGLAQWLAYGDLPRPDDVLSGQVSFLHHDGTPARTIIFLSTCARTLEAMGAQRDARGVDWMQRYWALVLPLIDKRPDLAFVALKPFMKISDTNDFLRARTDLGKQVMVAAARSGIVSL